MIYWVRSHNPARTLSGWMYELWISDGFELFFAVNILLPKFAALARSKQLMPFTMTFRIDFLVCGLQGDLLWYLSMSAPCFHVTKATEGMKNCRDSAFSNRLEVGLPAFQLPLLAKCDALPKRIEFPMFYFRNLFPPFFARAFNSLGVQRVGKDDLLSQESQARSNIIRMDVWVVNQWWIRIIFRCKYSVTTICCSR